MNGYCRMYRNEQGAITENYPDAYLNIYPVSSESIPMLHFYPNAIFLLISTIGCNFTCEGCISEFQTTRPGTLQEVLTHYTPDEILAIAREGDCKGITFCLNEPAVSLPTFLRVAQAAKKEGFLVGCSSNGYMTSRTLQTLIPYLDFVNIGLKGSTDERYRECGAISADPVYRNVRILHEAGIAVEVSVMYINGREREVYGASERIREISPGIPFQVMRFMGMHRDLKPLEPTRVQGEQLCTGLRSHLDHVFLFNTPATTELDTRCPVCGSTIVHRVFFGPMAARVLSCRPEGVCTCGYRFPYRGKIDPIFEGETRTLGGYRSIVGVQIIAEILRTLRVTDETEIDRIGKIVIAEGYIRNLQVHMSTIEAYLGMIRYVAGLAHREDQGNRLTEYMHSIVEDIRKKVAGTGKPRVYVALSHPLLPLYAVKFENILAEAAGGNSLNIAVDHKESSKKEFTADEVTALDPEVIFLSGHLAPSLADFLVTCKDLDITCKAISADKVYLLNAAYGSGTPRWILGLMEMANILHPELFHYSLEEEEVRFDNVINESAW